MSVAVIALVAGTLLLVWSAARFVEGSASAARHFGMPPLLIGMIIVGFGTSAPEMLASALAAVQGSPGIALGNVLGSNMFNTLAVVGIAGSIHPVSVGSEVFNRGIIFMALLTFFLFVVSYRFKTGQGRINRVEGGVLFACYSGYMAFLVKSAFAAP